MIYYKVIDKNRQIIDVLIDNEIEYIKWQTINKLFINCSKNEAEGFVSSDCNSIYHTDDLSMPMCDNSVEITEVTLKVITEDDYNILRKSIDESKPIDPEPEPTPEPEPEPDASDEDESEIDDNALELVRNGKISEMSKVCNNTITNGFDIVLSDGLLHHFSLTLDDQANLSTLSTDIIMGSTTLPYHADNEECQFFSIEDMTKIINTAKEYKTFHITYFNSLKLYISSLTNIVIINSINYGDEIPEEYKSAVLKSFYNKEEEGAEDE